jgi:malate dehydrogenase (oxaloacetate-decarboxylating)
MDPYKESIKLHRELGGKIETKIKSPIRNKTDLSIVYSPGVAAPCEEIARDKSLAKIYTLKKNTVAVVSDGSSLLGLGNIGPEAAMPVME